MCINILPSFCFFLVQTAIFLQSYSSLYFFRKMTLYPQKQNENKTKLINRTYLKILKKYRYEDICSRHELRLTQ